MAFRSINLTYCAAAYTPVISIILSWILFCRLIFATLAEKCTTDSPGQGDKIGANEALHTYLILSKCHTQGE